MQKFIGIHFDKLGNVYLNHSKEILEAYNEAVKCFVDQYNNLTQTDENKELNQVCVLNTQIQRQFILNLSLYAYILFFSK